MQPSEIQPTVYLLIGAPCTRKSTWVEQHREETGLEGVVLSRDDKLEQIITEERARENARIAAGEPVEDHITYDKLFDRNSQFHPLLQGAETEFWNDVEAVLSNPPPIVYFDRATKAGTVEKRGDLKKRFEEAGFAVVAVDCQKGMEKEQIWEVVQKRAEQSADPDIPGSGKIIRQEDFNAIWDHYEPVTEKEGFAALLTPNAREQAQNITTVAAETVGDRPLEKSKEAGHSAP